MGVGLLDWSGTLLGALLELREEGDFSVGPRFLLFCWDGRRGAGRSTAEEEVWVQGVRLDGVKCGREKRNRVCEPVRMRVGMKMAPVKMARWAGARTQCAAPNTNRVNLSFFFFPWAFVRKLSLLAATKTVGADR